MYAVSQDYLRAIHLPERYVDIKGIITFKGGAVIPVNNNSFQEASLYINKKAVDSDDLNVGSVYASELGVLIFYNESDYNSFVGAKIELSFGIELTLGEKDFEYVPLGVFYVDTAEKGAGVVKLIAYDSMLKFDKDYPQNQDNSTSNTIYNHLQNICNKCKVDLGTSKSEIESMPWGKSKVVINPNNYVGGYTACATYRDVIGAIAGRVGGFATIGRDNKLYIKQLKQKNSNYKLVNEQIFQAQITDCNPQITSVSFTRKNNSVILVGTEDGRNLTINNGNQFFDIGYTSDCEQLLEGILTVAKNISYFPSEITWSGDPAIDLGDYITLPEYEGGCVTLVTGMNWKYRGKSKIISVGKGSTSMIRGASSSSIAGIMSGIDNLNERVQEIINNSGSKDDGDHIIIDLQSNQDIVITESNKIDVIFSEYASISGNTFENGADSKSIYTPSILTSLTYNNAVLYSLPKGKISDTLIEKNNGMLYIERSCGHIVLDGTITPSEIISSGSDTIADGFFAVGWHDTKFDGAVLNTSNIYCNRLKNTNITSLVDITEPSIFVGERVRTNVLNTVCINTTMFIVLPTGTCEENETAVAEWLNSHNIEIIYPLAIPYVEEYEIGDISTLQNLVTIERDKIQHYDFQGGYQDFITPIFNATGSTIPYRYFTSMGDIWSETGSGMQLGGSNSAGTTTEFRIKVIDANGSYKIKTFTITNL